MPKFCIISNDLHTVRNFRGELLKEIAQQGYDIHILVPNALAYPEDISFFQQLNFEIHHFTMQKMGTNPIEDVKTGYSIYQILKQLRPEKVLSYTIKPVIYGTIAAYYAGVKERYVLLSGLGFAFQNNQIQGKFKYIKKVFDALFHFAMNKTHKVIFQNPDDLALIDSLGHLKQTQTALVNGSGVDIEHFDVQPLILNKQQECQPIFLMVARLLKDKGIYEYIHAAQAIKQHYPQAQFHLVGWIDENPAAITQHELDEWVNAKIITFWGKLADVRSVIQQTNIFVLPSYREGIPRSVLEAMSMGRAIITTDAPGCKETVAHGINGLKVPVACTQSLQNAMQQMILNPQNITTMGQRSRQLVLEKYDVKKVNAQMRQEIL